MAATMKDALKDAGITPADADADESASASASADESADESTDAGESTLSLRDRAIAQAGADEAHFVLADGCEWADTGSGKTAGKIGVTLGRNDVLMLTYIPGNGRGRAQAIPLYAVVKAQTEAGF